MKTTITTCDLCGAEINVGVDKGNFRLIGRNSRETVNVTTLDYQDLCYVCTAKLFFLIHKLINGVGKKK